MTIATGQTIRIDSKKRFVYTSDNSYENIANHSNFIKRDGFKIVKESAKAVQIERFVESKNKSYSVWVPKSAIDTQFTDAIVIEDWYYNDSFKRWFLTAK